MYETINSPINYGGLELKNRIIFAPTTFGLAEDEYFEKIRKIAAGGCAMVIIGDVPVGKSQFEKSLFDKKGFAHYQKLVEIVHSYDCRICAQLHQTSVVIADLRQSLFIAVHADVSIGNQHTPKGERAIRGIATAVA